MGLVCPCCFKFLYQVPKGPDCMLEPIFFWAGHPLSQKVDLNCTFFQDCQHCCVPLKNYNSHSFGLLTQKQAQDMPKSIINQTQRMYSVTQLTHHMMLIAYIPHSFPLSSCQLEIISSSSQRIVGGTVDKIYIPIISAFLEKSYSDINLQSTYFKYIAGSPIRRHFRRNKCVFKMSILVL